MKVSAGGLIEQTIPEQFSKLICISIGSLINSYGTEEEYTLGCSDELVEDPNLCLENLYAIRDIRKGEELVTDYADFSTASWEDFGL